MIEVRDPNMDAKVNNVVIPMVTRPEKKTPTLGTRSGKITAVKLSGHTIYIAPKLIYLEHDWAEQTLKTMQLRQTKRMVGRFSVNENLVFDTVSIWTWHCYTPLKWKIQLDRFYISKYRLIHREIFQHQY